MSQKGAREHLNSGPVPDGDEIQTEPSVGNVVDRRRLFGGHHRMNGWHVRRREYGGMFGRCAKAPSPTECLEALPIKIRSATKTAPTCNWEDRLKIHSVCTLSKRKYAAPNCRRRPGHLRHR